MADKKPSIKLNYLLNLLLTASGILFPLITYPYIARVLGPEGLGKSGFAFSLAGYLTILASFGIPMHGTREIALSKDNEIRKNRVFTSLMVMIFLTTLLALLIYASLFFFIPRMGTDIPLFVTAGFLILFSAFSMDWFFQGIEDYGFMTLRSLVFKVLSLLLVFLLIKNPQDYVIYTLISVIALTGSNIWNIFESRKYVRFDLSNVSLGDHIKPVFYFFLTSAIGNIYYTMDVALLGFFVPDRNVGYYVIDRKLTVLAVVLISSLGNVLLPRLSYLISQDKREDYLRMIEKAFSFILFISLPLAAGLFFLAPEVLSLFGGEKYQQAVFSLQLMTPIIVLMSLSSFFGFQVLIPHKQEKILVLSDIAGVLVLVAGTLLFSRFYLDTGAAVVIVLTECAVLGVRFTFGYRLLKGFRLGSDLLQYLAGSICAALLFILARRVVDNSLLRLAMGGGSAVVVYLVVLYLMKNQMMIMVIEKIRDIMKRKVKNV